MTPEEENVLRAENAAPREQVRTPSARLQVLEGRLAAHTKPAPSYPSDGLPSVPGERMLVVDKNRGSSRAARGVGLLACLLGVLCVTVSFFWLPLFSYPAWVGGTTLTGWESAMEIVKNMIAQGGTFGFILPLSLCFLPVIAPVILGVLAIARAATLRRALATLFLIVYALGSIPLLVVGIGRAFFGGVLRVGFLGALLGYILLLIGDQALRRAAAPGTRS